MVCVYKKNKNYIPENYYYKRKKENDKTYRILFKLICFFNIILIPVSVNCLKNNKSDKCSSYAQNVMASYDNVNKSDNHKNFKEMSEYLKLIQNSCIKEAAVNNESAYVKVNDLNEFYNSNLKNKFKVINAVKDEDGLCTLKVCVNE